MNTVSLLKLIIGAALCFLIFNISMRFDSWHKNCIAIGLVASFTIEFLILVSKPDIKDWIIETFLLGLIFPAAFTDFKYKKIINFNCCLLYIFSSILCLFNILNSNYSFFEPLFISAAICFVLVKLNALGSGDMALILPIVMVFQIRVFVIIFSACVFSLLLFFWQKISQKSDDKYVALAPGLLFGTIVAILIL